MGSERDKTTTAARIREWAERMARLGHHFDEHLACPACGTDSTVGCFAASSGDMPKEDRRG